MLSKPNCRDIDSSLILSHTATRLDVTLNQPYVHAHTFAQMGTSNSLTRKEKSGLAFHRLCFSRKTRRLGVSELSYFRTRYSQPAYSPRYYFGKLRQEHLIDTLSEHISKVHTHGFNPISIEPHEKDGGIFVLFEYTSSQLEDVLQAIQLDLRNHFQSRGGVPSSAGIRRGNIWVVQGRPWREVPSSYSC
jgi:hypothetical protein